MKRLIVFMAMAVLAFSGAVFAADPSWADEEGRPQLDVAYDCDNAVEQTVVASAAPVAVAMSARSDLAASADDPSVVAVSCASNEWCCKHDIGGTGACTKCCSK